MSLKKVAIFNLNSMDNLGVGPLFPIGVQAIASFLRCNGCNVDIFDWNYNEEKINKFDKFINYYDYIGFSIRNLDSTELGCESLLQRYTDFIDYINDLITNEDKKIITFAGGGAVTVYWNGLIDKITVDHLIVGNGEKAILELLDGKANRKIIYGHDDTEIFRNAIKFDEDLVKAYLNKEEFTAVGIPTKKIICSHNCVYCSYKAFEGNYELEKPLEFIIEEIDQLVSYGIKRIFFTDSIIEGNSDHFYKLIEIIQDRYCNKLKWSAFFTPNVDEKLMRLINPDMLDLIHFSFDSCSNKILDTFGKPFNVEDLVMAISRCKQYNLRFIVLVIFGGVSESEDTVKESCEFINKYLNSNEISFTFGIRVTPYSELQNILKCDVKNLIEPYFFKFDKGIYNVVLNTLDSKFLMATKVLKIISKLASYDSTKWIELER